MLQNNLKLRQGIEENADDITNLEERMDEMVQSILEKGKPSTIDGDPFLKHLPAQLKDYSEQFDEFKKETL